MTEIEKQELAQLVGLATQRIEARMDLHMAKVRHAWVILSAKLDMLAATTCRDEATYEKLKAWSAAHGDPWAVGSDSKKENDHV
jgi:hypothetical protein